MARLHVAIPVYRQVEVAVVEVEVVGTVSSRSWRRGETRCLRLRAHCSLMRPDRVFRRV